MEEILFRLSNQIEIFQIQTSMSVHQGQQYLGRCLTQSRQFFQDVSHGMHVDEIKEFFQQIVFWIQGQLRTFNPKQMYNQLNSFFFKVNKREIIYFLTGIFIGSFIGYSVALNWNPPKHSHHMKAIVCNHYVGVEGVTLIEDAEMPTLQKSNDLLIQVKAASVNETDVQICSGYSRTYRRLLNSGKYKDLPVILGRDCAGVVVDIGHSVINFDIGDNVFLAVPSWSVGTMAEYIVVPETYVAKMPKVLPYEASASLPYSGCIAWDALINCKTFKHGDAKGKRILVYGGSTPVGCILIQLIKLWGGYIVTICKPQAAAVIKALGADEVIEFNKSVLFKELEFCDKFDAIFYTGRQWVDDRILKKHLVPHGSYVSTAPEYLISDSLGYITGSLFSGYIRVKLLLKYVFGTNIFHWKEGDKLKTSYLQSLQQLADADKLQPILDRVYKPYHIDQALTHLMDSSAIGSTVIVFREVS